MVDTVGNRLGPRKAHVYISDSSINYNVLLDESVSEALGNAASTNALLPVLRASGKRPVEPRYVLLSLNSDTSVRKKAIVCNPENALWVSSAASTVTINGVAWTITGRIGEKRSTLIVDEPPP